MKINNTKRIWHLAIILVFTQFTLSVGIKSIAIEKVIPGTPDNGSESKRVPKIYSIRFQKKEFTSMKPKEGKSQIIEPSKLTEETRQDSPVRHRMKSSSSDNIEMENEELITSGNFHYPSYKYPTVVKPSNKYKYDEEEGLESDSDYGVEDGHLSSGIIQFGDRIKEEYEDDSSNAFDEDTHDESYGGHFEDGILSEKGHEEEIKDSVSKGHSDQGFHNFHRKVEYGFSETFGDEFDDSSFASDHDSDETFFDSDHRDFYSDDFNLDNVNHDVHNNECYHQDGDYVNGNQESYSSGDSSDDSSGGTQYHQNHNYDNRKPLSPDNHHDNSNDYGNGNGHHDRGHHYGQDYNNDHGLHNHGHDYGVEYHQAKPHPSSYHEERNTGEYLRSPLAGANYDPYLQSQTLVDPQPFEKEGFEHKLDSMIRHGFGYDP